MRLLLLPLHRYIIVQQVILVAFFMKYVVAAYGTESLIEIQRLDFLELRLVLLAYLVLLFEFEAQCI